MHEPRSAATTRDYQAFLHELQSAGLRLELEPDLEEYVQLVRETAFRAGWAAGQAWQEQHHAEAPTARCTPPSTVRALASVGDRAWVQPLAIVEHMGTGERFVDPRFTITREPSDRCCIELVVTDAGLVASGPPNRHRLSPEIDRDRLRPLLRFEALTVG